MMTEFTDALEAARAYEANLGAMEITKDLATADAEDPRLMNPIQSIHAAADACRRSADGPRRPPRARPRSRTSCCDSIQEVNSMQQAADQAVEKLATGGDVNPAEVLTAVQKADIAFRMMMQIRNKMVEAYEEVQAIRV